MHAHPFCFIGFQRAGVRLLFRDTHIQEDIQYCPALHFQFACQIVDSNFAHPSLFLDLPYALLALHISLTR
jgi:hypothetical protein